MMYFHKSLHCLDTGWIWLQPHSVIFRQIVNQIQQNTILCLVLCKPDSFLLSAMIDFCPSSCSLNTPAHYYVNIFCILGHRLFYGTCYIFVAGARSESRSSKLRQIFRILSARKQSCCCPAGFSQLIVASYIF